MDNLQSNLTHVSVAQTLESILKLENTASHSNSRRAKDSSKPKEIELLQFTSNTTSLLTTLFA